MTARSSWLALVPLAVVALAGCAPKAKTDAGASGAPVTQQTEEERAAAAAEATPTPESAQPAELVRGAGESVPVETTLWTRSEPLAVDRFQILTKEGVLKKVAPPSSDADQMRFFPFAMDYWGIVGSSELEAVLAPHVGRPVRIVGHFRKIYDSGNWFHDVEPQAIVLLPEGDGPESGQPDGGTPAEPAE